MAKSDFFNEKEDNVTALIFERREHQFSPSLGRGVVERIPVLGGKESSNGTQVSKASEGRVQRPPGIIAHRSHDCERVFSSFVIKENHWKCPLFL